MGKKFEAMFGEPVAFYPDGLYLSRNAFTRDEAAEAFSEELDQEVNADSLAEKWVRFQFTPEEARSELGCDHCWMEVHVKTKGAQPVWCCDAG